MTIILSHRAPAARARAKWKDNSKKRGSAKLPQMFIFCGYCARESRWDTPVVGGTVTTGWHPDPFGLHEARYFNADGQPTKLVRNRGLESYDEPPPDPDEVAAAMARMSAVPEPSADPPRDAYGYDRAPRRDSWRPSIRQFAVTWVIAVAAAVGIYFGAQAMLQTPKPASTPGGTSGPGGAADVAFVTQAATRTLQQHTADVVVSASTAMGGDASKVRGTGAFDLGGKAGTMNMTVDSGAYKMALREILVNGYVYLGITINGQSLLPPGKTWVAEQAPAPQASGMNLTGANPTATLASLENQEITVRALGTKVIGGVSCTGYAVTSPGAQSTTTVWINPQHLVRELSMNATLGLSADGGSASPAPTSTNTALSLDLTMDLTYSATPVQVTAPSAASTTTIAAFLQQLLQSPAGKQFQTGSLTG